MFINIHEFVRGKQLVPDRLVFEGGHHKFGWLPRIVRWAGGLVISWLGGELVFMQVLSGGRVRTSVNFKRTTRSIR